MLLIVAAGCSPVIQRADLSFEPTIANPAYDKGQGPTVLIDEAHFNYHTADGRYAPFAKLLRRDGYVVRGLGQAATRESLAQASIYVVANAIAESDVSKWKLPTEQAFSASEIEAIHNWVVEGGSLFLIADHMPMPGAVSELAAAFGVLFGNGFVYDEEGTATFDFTRDTGGLAGHVIVEGRDEAERVDTVRTFTGQAFRAEHDIEPLLVLPSGSTLLLPIEAWKFKPETPQVPAAGMLQGAVMRCGEGRIAVFGEAARFSAQEQIRKTGRTVMGMSHADAAQNPQFLLNVMHWLSALID